MKDNPSREPKADSQHKATVRSAEAAHKAAQEAKAKQEAPARTARQK